MKNVTLSADESLIEAARERARSEQSTLNAEFRRWLRSYTQQKDKGAAYDALMEDLGARYTTDGRKFTREEMNDL